MKVSFLVGDGEKHRVEVCLSRWSGMERIYVDGERVVSKFSFAGGKYRFQVSDSGKHEVEIVVSGVFPPKVEMFVDGEFHSRG